MGVRGVNIKWACVLVLLVTALHASVFLGPSKALADECFGLITDTHIGLGATVESDLKKALSYIKGQENLEAVIHVGDVTNVGGLKEYKKYAAIWKSSSISVPHIATVGNHDNAIGGYQVWLHRFGYYRYSKNTGLKYFKNIINKGAKYNRIIKFDTVNVIVVGHGVRSGGGVYPRYCVKWLDEKLKETVRSGKMALVITHYAPWHGVDNKFKVIPKNLRKIYGVCQSYPNVIYACGHEHRFEQDRKHFKAHYTYRTYSKAEQTRFKRVGIDTSKVKYPVHLLCLNAVSRIKGVYNHHRNRYRFTWAYLLKTSDNGKLKFVQYNVTNRETARTTTFKQKTSSNTISVKAPASVRSIEVKVWFSDNGTYSGIKSGSIVRVANGKSKKIRGIPQGVLVKVAAQTSISGYKTPDAKALEMTKKASKMSFSYKKKGLKLRGSSL